MSILRRIFRRGPDARATAALIEILATRSMSGRAASEPDEVVRGMHLPRSTRAVAVIELDAGAAPLRHVVVSRLGGDAAGHMGRITVTGAHVVLDRAALPAAAWPPGWATPILAQPQDQGPFKWHPLDATGAGAAEAASQLSGSDRVARNVKYLLDQPQTLQVEVVPAARSVRISVHQGGAGLPQPTVVEALLAVARTIAGADR